MSAETPKVGRFVWEEPAFQAVYRRYEPFLSDGQKTIVRSSVCGEEYAEWFIQGGADLIHSPMGYGVTLTEAAEDFLKKFIAGRA